MRFRYESYLSHDCHKGTSRMHPIRRSRCGVNHLFISEMSAKRLGAFGGRKLTAFAAYLALPGNRVSSAGGNQIQSEFILHLGIDKPAHWIVGTGIVRLFVSEGIRARTCAIHSREALFGCAIVYTKNGGKTVGNRQSFSWVRTQSGSKGRERDS